MRGRKTLAALTTALVMLAGCSSDGDITASPSPPVPVPASACATDGAAQDDITFYDAMCKAIVVGEVAAYVQKALEEDYKTEILLPGETLTCVRDGQEVTVTGKDSIRGFCDNWSRFVLTRDGIKANVIVMSELAVGFVIAAAAAGKRYPTSQGGRTCAAAYAVSKRPGATPEMDRQFFAIMIHNDWREPQPAHVYAEYGQQLALSGKTVAGCDNPQVGTATA